MLIINYVDKMWYPFIRLSDYPEILQFRIPDIRIRNASGLSDIRLSDYGTIRGYPVSEYPTKTLSGTSLYVLKKI